MFKKPTYEMLNTEYVINEKTIFQIAKEQIMQ